MGEDLKKLNTMTTGPSNSTLRYAPHRSANRCANKSLYMNFYVHQQMSRLNKWVGHTMQSSSAVKRSEALTHATMWISLDNTMLSDRSQVYDSIKCLEWANSETEAG